MTNTERILKELEPLFTKATEEKLWFHNSRQGLFLSPSELRKYHSKGMFVWGAVNWDLVNPNDEVERLEAERNRIDEKITTMKDRIVAD